MLLICFQALCILYTFSYLHVLNLSECLIQVDEQQKKRVLLQTTAASCVRLYLLVMFHTAADSGPNI